MHRNVSKRRAALTASAFAIIATVLFGVVDVQPASAGTWGFNVYNSSGCVQAYGNVKTLYNTNGTVRGYHVGGQLAGHCGDNTNFLNVYAIHFNGAVYPVKYAQDINFQNEYWGANWYSNQVSYFKVCVNGNSASSLRCTLVMY